MSKSASIESCAYISSQEVEPVLNRDLEAAKEAVAHRFNGEVAALVLGGSFGRGEGCLWYQNGRWVPGNDLNFFLIAPRRLDPEELDRLRQEILAHTLVRAIDLVPLVKSALPFLPPTVANVDLKAGHRTIAGDPAVIDLLPPYEPGEIPRREAERILRKRLVTLLEAYPQGDNFYRSYYLSARAIFAGVDALLIRLHAYATSYRQKAERFQGLIQDEHLQALAECALNVKLGLDIHFAYDPMEFWRRAVRFVLDNLLGLYRVRGPFRADRLQSLLFDFHIHSVEWKERVKRRALSLLGRNALGRTERFLLALLINADAESFYVDLAPLARQAGLPAARTWEEYLPPAIEAWQRRRPPATRS